MPLTNQRCPNRIKIKPAAKSHTVMTRRIVCRLRVASSGVGGLLFIIDNILDRVGRYPSASPDFIMGANASVDAEQTSPSRGSRLAVWPIKHSAIDRHLPTV